MTMSAAAIIAALGGSRVMLGRWRRVLCACAAIPVVIAFAAETCRAQQSYQDYRRQLEEMRQEQDYNQQRMEQQLRELRDEQQRYEEDQRWERQRREDDESSRRTRNRLRSEDDD